MKMRRGIFCLCMALIAAPAVADTCADLVKVADRVADIRDAGVEQRMLRELPEANGDGRNAALTRALADVAYRYPRADGRTLAGMYQPACARHPEALTR